MRSADHSHTAQAQSRRARLSGLLIGLLLLALILLLTAFTSLNAVSGLAGEDEPTPAATLWLSSDRTEPVLPANALMADKGAAKFWMVCMACHGDRGQGLTDDWRQRGFGEDMNCWQSKCHGSNHPPEGFQFPRIVPPAIGPTTLKRFVASNELQHYLFEKMPWWAPGTLTSDEAWHLTAFLLRENGTFPADLEFDPKEGRHIPARLPFQPRPGERAGQSALFASLGLIAALLAAGSFTANGARLRSKALARPKNGQAQVEGPPGATTETEATIPSERKHRPNFLVHLHPPSIPLPQARFRYTLGAGGLAVFLSLVLGITGTLEMFFYIPTPEQAGLSIQTITFLAPFGGLIRGMHFWAAQALVAVAAIHLARVVFTGAYVPPRRFNYLLGLALFVLILLFDFTGYVLRWDEGIQWALMVGTNLLKTIPWIGDGLYGAVIGGVTPGLATLIRFYAWHIFGLTLIMAIILVWHLFRVRRDGGISAPAPELRLDARRITRYELAQREALAMLIAGMALILVSSLVPAPLAPPIQNMTLGALQDVRAPWFFLWIQQLLRYGDAFWMGVAIPLGLLAILVAIPYIYPRLPEEQKGRWFPRAGRAAQAILALIALAWLALTILELMTTQ